MDRFMVGTGRCGSTLLSRMVGTSPDVCSVFEFFNGLDIGSRFGREPVGGAALADLLGREQSIVNEMLRRGYNVPEITYPFGPDARHTPQDGLPWLLVSMLPRLAEDPHPLFDGLMEMARARPRAPLWDHYRAVFEWLAEQTGRGIWIERSGSSVEYLEELHRFFPDARFLHLHRDGHEAALSMREHHAYRLAVSLLYRGTGDDPAAGASDPMTHILETRPEPELFGRYWSEQVVRGFRALKKLAPEQYLEVRFEHIVSHPVEWLQRVAAFFEIDPAREGWLERAAAIVRGAPPTRFERLSEDEQERLARACRPGQQLLGRVP